MRSIIIPVLDHSPHSPFNIRTLLDDIAAICRDRNGDNNYRRFNDEIICIFNDERMLHCSDIDYSRIDKWCLNSANAGVSRSWNMGLQLAEGDVAFVLNADLHLWGEALDDLEMYLRTLDDAAIVGPQGSHLDYRKLVPTRYFEKGMFTGTIATDDVSGFFFATDLNRFRNAGLSFDVRFSPCLTEEWDMGLQIRKAGLKCYAVPVTEFEHHWGISHRAGATVNYFGREMKLSEIREKNRKALVEKWQPIFPELFGPK